METRKNILAFGSRENVLNSTADELEARGVSCIRRYCAATFPDDLETWKDISLVFMDPACGYASFPEEWQAHTKEGAFSGIVLLEKLVPEAVDRSILPIVLRSTIYHLGIYRAGRDISPEELSVETKTRLNAAGYREVHILEGGPSTATRTTDQILALLR